MPINEPWKEPADVDYGREVCRICAGKCDVPGAKLCNGCWGLSLAFNTLATRDASAAGRWLRSMARLHAIDCGRDVS